MLQEPHGDGSAHLISLRQSRWDDAEGNLSVLERTRAARFANDLDRQRYARLRLFTRTHLAECYGVDTGEVELARAPCARCGDKTHGAPIAKIGAFVVQLSLSRSGDVGGLLVGGTHPVGLDIEHEFQPDIFAAVWGVLSESEIAALSDAGQLHDAAVLTRAWTRKEAVMKAIGIGFFLDPKLVDVRPECAGQVIARCNEPGWESNWDVHSIRAGALHLAAAFRDPPAGEFRCIDHGSE